MKLILMVYSVVLLFVCSLCHAIPGLDAIKNYNEVNEKWRITAYCGCPKCCGKYSDGHFASGRKVYVGGVACNWLSFGTKVVIDGLGTYTVEDRGAKSYFGDKDNHIKHLDVYFDDHGDALEFGNQYRRVTVL